MADIEQSQQPKTQVPEHNNVVLIYEYTHYQLALINHSIDICVAKLSFVFALTVGLILSLPSEIILTNVWVSCLNTTSCVMSLVTLCFCIAGFQPKAAGDLASVEFLLNNQYYDSDEIFRLSVARTALEGLKQLEELRDFRAKKAGAAIWCLGAAIACKAIGWIGFELLNQLMK